MITRRNFTRKEKIQISLSLSTKFGTKYKGRDYNAHPQIPLQRGLSLSHFATPRLSLKQDAYIENTFVLLRRSGLIC